MQDILVRFLGWEDSLEKGWATYSSVLGLPLWLSWQRIFLQCGRPGFDLWVGKIPWRRGRLPTPVFLPRQFHELYRVSKSQTRLSNFHFQFSLLSPSAWDCKFHEGRSLVCPVCCCPEQYTEGSLWLNGVEWASDQWVSGLFLSSNEGEVLWNWFHFVSVIRAPSTMSETPSIFDVLKLCWKTIISIENRQFQISEFSRILRNSSNHIPLNGHI